MFTTRDGEPVATLEVEWSCHKVGSMITSFLGSALISGKDSWNLNEPKAMKARSFIQKRPVAKPTEGVGLGSHISDLTWKEGVIEAFRLFEGHAAQKGASTSTSSIAKGCQGNRHTG